MKVRELSQGTELDGVINWKELDSDVTALVGFDKSQHQDNYRATGRGGGG